MSQYIPRPRLKVILKLLMILSFYQLKTILNAVVLLIKKNKCNVISLYRTPAGNLEIFFSKFEELLGLTDTPGYQNFICGDINIDVSSNTPASQNLQQMLLSHSYRLTINEPTRITATSSTIIDNIITNSNNILYAKPITTALSDHEALMTEFIQSPCNDCNITRTQHVRFFHQESLDYFRFLIKNESWENVVISNDANTAFNEFLDTFLIHFNSAFTKKRTRFHISKTYRLGSDPRVISIAAIHTLACY